MPSRLIGDLTFQDVGKSLRATAILCVPLGSMEQHGPHLPLNTDAIIAEALTRRIVARWAKAYDVWQLPPLPVGLSREHDWAPGTLSLSVQGMTTLLRDLGRDIARSLPVKNVAFVNGHGGNRGILEAVLREFRADFGLNACAMHLGAMMSPVPDAGTPEVHGGRDETSVMLALAPDLVRRKAIRTLKRKPDRKAIHALILDPAVSFPWSSGDPRIADLGVIGDASAASAAHGKAIVERVVEAAGGVFKLLLESRKPAR
jgi:creatinine amidohydrolase/Fe(II)-dependent formamide hydrolase-like protein